MRSGASTLSSGRIARGGGFISSFFKAVITLFSDSICIERPPPPRPPALPLPPPPPVFCFSNAHVTPEKKKQKTHTLERETA